MRPLHAQLARKEETSRTPEAANWTYCRKRACMVEGLNEVDKLKASLAKYARDLN